MRKQTLKGAKAKAWKTISEYIRRRDGGVCFTCGKKDDWRAMDCGHYIAKTGGLAIYFLEKNLASQCTFCNRFKHGNLAAYAIALRQKYGPNILEELDAERRKIKKYTVAEYQALTEKYIKLIEGL